jgi:transcriptional regulator with XRE-family HTH domain
MIQIPTRTPFGDLLRFYRGKTVDRDVGKPLSQEKLARRISERIGLMISRNIVSNWENGKSDLHPQKDRNLLTAIVSTLYKYRGIATLDEANHLLEIGDYRALDEKEISNIDPKWVHSMHTRGTELDLSDEPSMSSIPRRRVNLSSPITLNIESRDNMPVVVRTPKSEPMDGSPPSTLSIGHDSDRSTSKENPAGKVVDKSKVTIQIRIAIQP